MCSQGGKKCSFRIDWVLYLKKSKNYPFWPVCFDGSVMLITFLIFVWPSWLLKLTKLDSDKARVVKDIQHHVEIVVVDIVFLQVEDNFMLVFVRFLSVMSTGNSFWLLSEQNVLRHKSYDWSVCFTILSLTFLKIHRFEFDLDTACFRDEIGLEFNLFMTLCRSLYKLYLSFFCLLQLWTGVIEW